MSTDYEDNYLLVWYPEEWVSSSLQNVAAYLPNYVVLTSDDRHIHGQNHEHFSDLMSTPFYTGVKLGLFTKEEQSAKAL